MLARAGVAAAAAPKAPRRGCYCATCTCLFSGTGTRQQGQHRRASPQEEEDDRINENAIE
jgi:hypothetical protein